MQYGFIIINLYKCIRVCSGCDFGKFIGKYIYFIVLKTIAYSLVASGMLLVIPLYICVYLCILCLSMKEHSIIYCMRFVEMYVRFLKCLSLTFVYLKVYIEMFFDWYDFDGQSV